jgi:hypothetical protein
MLLDAAFVCGGGHGILLAGPEDEHVHAGLGDSAAAKTAAALSGLVEAVDVARHKGLRGDPQDQGTRSGDETNLDA